MKLDIDNPIQGQWAFGVVSWHRVQGDWQKGREVYFAFWRWAVRLTIGGPQ